MTQTTPSTTTGNTVDYSDAVTTRPEPDAVPAEVFAGYLRASSADEDVYDKAVRRINMGLNMPVLDAETALEFAAPDDDQ